MVAGWVASGACTTFRAGWRSLSSAAPLLAEDVTALLTDCRSPASWYPPARALRREVVAHLGPTNSGKTWAALQQLRQARNGVYCGPLRLLAWEVCETLTDGGTPCNLVTGQERRDLGAPHTACTVEMASVKQPVDVAVVDEIQLMGDQSRGWAFSRALLGLPARTLHVCGDPAILPLLRAMCEETGDTLRVERYERLSPLAVGRQSLLSLARARPHDCFVSFSRREVHHVRSEVEKLSGQRCGVVYRALPPDARQIQARLFNTPRSGISVLSASDAVGMGLNLSIKRVVLTSLSKYDGICERPLSAAEIRQIAGRAGRGVGVRGVVTTLHPEDLPALQEAMAQPPEDVEVAHLFPPYELLASFAGQLRKECLATALERFQEEAVLSSNYALSHFEEQHALALMLRHLPLSLREAFLFSVAPADPTDAPVAAALLTMATAFAHNHRLTPLLISHPPLRQARSEAELQQLEATFRIYDLYLWLAHRFDAFERVEEAAAARAKCASLVDASIQAMGAPPRCSKHVMSDWFLPSFLPVLCCTKRQKRQDVEALAELAQTEEEGDLSGGEEGEAEQPSPGAWLERRSSYAKHRRR